MNAEQRGSAWESEINTKYMKSIPDRGMDESEWCRYRDTAIGKLLEERDSWKAQAKNLQRSAESTDALELSSKDALELTEDDLLAEQANVSDLEKDHDLLRKALLEGWEILRHYEADGSEWSEFYDPDGGYSPSYPTPEAALAALVKRLREETDGE